MSLLDDYWFLTEADILEAHRQALQGGEIPTIKDMNALGSAITRPKHLLTYEGDQPVFVLASAVSVGLSKNHVFTDGNKRTAFLALTMMLEENGYHLTLSQDKAVDLMEGIAKA